MLTARQLVRHRVGLDRVHDGIAGVRDVDAPCVDFEPGKPNGNQCDTDGHYLCRECIHAPSEDVTRWRSVPEVQP